VTKFVTADAAGLFFIVLIYKSFLGWHGDCFKLCMQSELIALWLLEGSERAALVVRRADGQFALERIDARLASAALTAATYHGHQNSDDKPEHAAA
jgi:hypothetical protein